MSSSKALDVAVRPVSLALLLTAFAASSCSRHPLQGSWVQQHAADGAMRLEFDPAGDRVFGHGGGDEASGHDHLNGTYTLRGSAVEILAAWEHTGRKVEWKGEVAGDTLVLRGAEGALEFRRENGR